MYSKISPRMTCDEENQQVKGYKITMNYKHNSSNIVQYNVVSDQKILFTLSYEHNGMIYMVNKGVRVKSKSSSEIDLQAFNFCSASGLWLPEGKAAEHINECQKKGQKRNLYEKLWLFIEGNHDVVVFNFPIIGDPDKTTYYTTLKEIIFQSLILTYNLDESELNSFINPIPGKEEQSIVIFETDEGGTGVLKSLLNTSTIQFEKFVENMFKIIHIQTVNPYNETMDACISACYNCLLRFRNQFEHKFLDRRTVVPLIKSLINCDLEIISEKNSTSKPMDFDTLLKKCDSEFEKAVLKSILKMKLPLPNDAQKTYFENDIPVTKADFYYKRANNEIYVFVDGPPHTSDYIKKGDKEKREKIESKGFSVVELDFVDGGYTKDNSIIEKEIEEQLKPYIND